jgi:class 3 adenylate cyclase
MNNSAAAVVTPDPVRRTIAGIDVEASTELNNVQKVHLRRAMYEALERALADSGVAEGFREPFEDRGDGAFVFIHPVDSIPRHLLVTKFVPLLRKLLGSRRFRLRVAIHDGDIVKDDRGPFGEDVDLLARLLDAQELKNQLARSDEPLILVVSDHFYRTVVKHGYGGIDPGRFRPLVRFRMAGQFHRGWIEVPPGS